MSEQTYLNLLILCGISFQGIIGTFLEDNRENSSHLHSRKKRATDVAPVEHRELSITDVTYIVEVLKNGARICAGIIVSPEHILTTEECVNRERARYSVKSGHLFIHTIQNHNVIHKVMERNLALLLVRPYINLKSPSPNRAIQLFERPAEPPTLATVSGFTTRSATNEPLTFRRSTYVPIVSLHLCYNYYIRHERVLTDDNICALESSGETGFTLKDRGSALVVDEQLVGVLTYTGNIISHTSPDVFIRVNDNSTYNGWIKSFIEPYLQSQLYHPHNLNPQTHSPHPNTSQNQSPHPNISQNQSPHSHTPQNQSPHPHTSQNPSAHLHPSRNPSPHSQTSQNPSSSNPVREE